MKQLCWSLFLLFPVLLLGENTLSSVRAHLTIHNPGEAITQTREALKLKPSDQELQEGLILALAANGDVKQMFQVWRTYKERFPEKGYRRDLLEALAWGVVEKERKSPSPQLRSMALIASFYSQDSKGVDYITQAMNDPNQLIRLIALQLASQLPDRKAKLAALERLRIEKSWKVRLAAIQAVGAMKADEAKKDLFDLLSSPETQDEEKFLIMESLSNILDTPPTEALVDLAQSDRAGLRELASHLIGHFERSSLDFLLSQQLQDPIALVRAKALTTLIELHSSCDLVEGCMQDQNPLVAITATWGNTLLSDQADWNHWEPWLNHHDPEIARLGAAALANTGKKGTGLVYQAFTLAKDPFIKGNLALGLIGERNHTEEATGALSKLINETSQKMMGEQKGHFEVLAPSHLSHSQTFPLTPEEQDQLLRLKLLNIVAIVNPAEAQNAIKRYLQKKTWGVSAIASMLLLQEGDEKAISVVEELINDQNPKIRIQAALILSLWGGGDRAFEILQKAWPSANKELKERILEGIGQIHHEEVIPFLANHLGEGQPTLRLIAAASLLHALYQ